MNFKQEEFKKVLDNLSSFKAILLFGKDSGLIRDFSKKIIDKILGKEKAPFSLIQLGDGEEKRLEEEARSISLLGGKRVICITHSKDSLISDLKDILDIKTDAFIVLEGDTLTNKSSLVKLASNAKDIASISCYPREGYQLSNFINAQLKKDKIFLTRAAELWLSENIASDHSIVLNEIEKLSLYAKEGEKLDLDDVQKFVGDSGDISLEMAVYNALSGNRKMAEKHFERAVNEFLPMTLYTRTTLRILQKLQHAHYLVEAGETLENVMKKINIFWKMKKIFRDSYNRWNIAALDKVSKITQKLEYDMRDNSLMPEVILCRYHLFRLASKPQ